MAPQSAQTDAARAPDLLLYVMKKALSVVVGGHEVGAVGVVQSGTETMLQNFK